MEQGKIFKFHNDLDTDQIIASQYLLLPNLDEMKGHAFESLDPDFAKKVKPGDFVVGGENFGCGSSREQAPGVLKALGVQAVIAKSFARIFFRNAINIGLPAIVCKDLPDAVEDGDTMVLHMSEGTAEVNGKTYTCTKLPEYMQNILNQGGLIQYVLHIFRQFGAEHTESGRLDCLFEPRGGVRTMGMTIAEKIIAAAAGVPEVKPGDIHTVTLDRLMSNDGTTHLTVDMYRNKLNHPHIADPKKLVFIVDHNVPSDSPKTAASQKKMRDFARENSIDFWEGKGVCHQVMIENYVRPGELIFGADSHTCSYGALGAFGTGVGCTDFLYGMVTGTSWVLVPESVKFNLVGKLPEGVYARDLILTIIGEVGANGCNYQVMEFTGEGAKTLSISDRMALCNMAVEAGAKTGIFEADEKAIEYLKEHGREPKEIFHSDPDAKYVREYTFDLSKVRPVVAKPDFVDRVVPAEETCGTPINEAFLGSCNNGRIEDLRVGAEIIRGKKVAEGVRFLVVPASQTIYRQALKEGIIDTFMEAGAIVMNPNCSVCWGSCQGVIGENEVLISTGTRNFKGRAGHPSSKVYLGSAATVTASAIAGKIATADQI